MATQPDMIPILSGRAKERYRYTILGRFMAMVMVHRQDFNPRRAIAIPPTIPPIVRAMTPIVP